MPRPVMGRGYHKVGYGVRPPCSFTWGYMAALPLPYGAALRAAKTTGLKGAACKMRPAL
ncbi:CASP-like protein 4A3 [Acetobacter orientalis]|uniref:CASP-like protein 4A3 n=1 Tax=Acetobacter orientalis TaxID=146474 RepID=A0A2Z5ZJ85_9PROT|nr:CASP-like protein 4A3 [Acetobacter orientalis]